MCVQTIRNSDLKRFFCRVTKKNVPFFSFLISSPSSPSSWQRWLLCHRTYITRPQHIRRLVATETGDFNRNEKLYYIMSHGSCNTLVTAQYQVITILNYLNSQPSHTRLRMASRINTPAQTSARTKNPTATQSGAPILCSFPMAANRR